MPTWAGLIVTLFAAAAVIGSTFAVMRSNVAKTTSELWKGEAEAANAKADRLEEEHRVCQTKLDALRVDHDALKQIVEDALRRAPASRTRTTDRKKT